jgi:hypothetical protein
MAFKLGFVIIALITAVGLYDITRLDSGAQCFAKAEAINRGRITPFQRI